MGQNPYTASIPAIPKDTKHKLPKNITAPRTLKEQFGQISIRSRPAWA
jgi:hypothetical protein